MSDPLREAVRRLRDMKRDVERLKGADTREGEVNILRLVTETGSSSDSVSRTVESAGSATWDQDNWDQSRWQQ